MVFYTRQQEALNNERGNKMAKMNKGERRFYSHPRDCGAVGKNIEVDGRIAGNKDTKILHVQGVGKPDIVRYFKAENNVKSMFRIESKINGGTATEEYAVNIFDGIALDDREALESYIFPNAEYVLYGVIDGSDYNVYEDMFIFTRKEFIDVLFGYSCPMLKRNFKNGYCLNIQCLNSDKRKNYMIEACLDKPMYGDWLLEMESK